jgi:RNA polymerase sigma-70 factor (ECF subfamily)
MESRPSEGEEQERDRVLQDSLLLLGRAKGGSREAMDRLLQRYQDRLRRIARVRMGRELRGAMESMDLVQQALAVASRKLASFEPREHAQIIHWLGAILENQMRDARKHLAAEKRDRALEVPLDARGLSSSDPGLARAWDERTPSVEAGRREIEEIYDALVRELPGEQREVILLRDYEGGSWEFVRERLGRANVHAVQELHRRARLSLSRLAARRLGPEGGGLGAAGR